MNHSIRRMRHPGRIVAVLAVLGMLALARPAHPAQLSEYRLKAAVLYNFALFTEWPSDSDSLTLCVYGTDPFGADLDALVGKLVGVRRLAVRRSAAGTSLAGCQIVFITRSALPGLPGVLDALRDAAVLTVADSPGAALQGIALNMTVTDNKVTFEANLQAARAAGLNLSSKLLRLATVVIQ